MKDLRDVGVDFLTIGQYLQPSKKHLKVEKFVPPDEFDELALHGDKMGFEYVASGPLVRSSYKAAEFYIERKIREMHEFSRQTHFVSNSGNFRNCQFAGFEKSLQQNPAP